MPNQSIIAVPPNVDEPVILRRFLSLLVEQLDIVEGKRTGAENAYVEQDQLSGVTDEATAAVAVAVAELAEATRRLNLATVELRAARQALLP